MTKTLNQIIFFFLHQNQNIFFSNIGNQNIFLEKNHNPPLQVKWSFPQWCHSRVGSCAISGVFKSRQFLLHQWCLQGQVVPAPLVVSSRVGSSCSISGFIRLALVTSSVISYERVKERIVITTNRTYMWSFMVNQAIIATVKL